MSVCLYLLKAMYVRFICRSMSVSVSSNVPRYLHFLQSFFCFLLILCFIVFVSFIVKFFLSWSNIFHRFVYVVFVVADKSNVICILLVNYIVCYVVLSCFMQ